MDWFWAFLMKPAVSMILAVGLIVFIVSLKWIIWKALPDGWLRTFLFRYRGQYDPKPPPGTGKYLLDDPTLTSRQRRKDSAGL